MVIPREFLVYFMVILQTAMATFLCVLRASAVPLLKPQRRKARGDD